MALIVSRLQGTDRQTMSVIELSWAAKNVQWFRRVALDRVLYILLLSPTFNLVCLLPAVLLTAPLEMRQVSQGPSLRISAAHISLEFLSYFLGISPFSSC